MTGIEKQSMIDVNAKLARAVRFHQDGQLLKAGQIYQAILDRYPTHADTLHLAGLLAHQTGDDKGAVDLITKAIHLFQDNPLYHHNLGLVLEDLGKSDEALNCYR
jgi:protein O-GlcNAc transferase